MKLFLGRFLKRYDGLSMLPLFALMVVGAAAFGFLAARRSQAAGDGPSAAGREVAQKVWVTESEIKDRFSPAQHEAFMRRAIANSRRAGVEERTGGAFGAVIVNRAGEVIADGSNHVVANHDPTWHGEMEAIRNACARMKVLKLDGCLLYTSSEPCPMCLATAYWAGLDGVVFGATVADAKKYGGFDDAFIYEQLNRAPASRAIPQVQLLQDEAVKVWKEYAAQPGNVAY